MVYVITIQLYGALTMVYSYCRNLISVEVVYHLDFNRVLAFAKAICFRLHVNRQYLIWLVPINSHFLPLRTMVK